MGTFFFHLITNKNYAMNKESGFTWKLGMFVTIGLFLFAIAIYFIGKEKNLFGATFHLRAEFRNVSGLKVGNNVRFSGIDVGTVNEIQLINDSSVMVDLLVKKEVQQFIKTDAVASIGSDGLMGDKVLMISSGTATNEPVKDNDLIASKNAIEMQDIMSSVKTSVDNAGIITGQLAQFTYKMNNGNGVLSKLTSDQDFSNSLKGTLANLQTSSSQFAQFTTRINKGNIGKHLDSTMANLQEDTKGVKETIDAAQHSFLLRGYFKKKEKEAKKQADLKQQNNSNDSTTNQVPITKDSTK
jgi:phospholipid/cholesterol/gamma-HCH transport system substrate-binding protein